MNGSKQGNPYHIPHNWLMADLTEMIALRLSREQAQVVAEWARTHNSTVSEVIRVAIEMMTGARR
jgi:hypothetical protein